MSHIAYARHFQTKKSYTQPSTIIAIIVIFTMVSVLAMNSSFTSLTLSFSSYAFYQQEFPRTAIRTLVRETKTCTIQALLAKPTYNLVISSLYWPPFLKVSLTSCLTKFHVSDLAILPCQSSVCLVFQQHLVFVYFGFPVS